MKNVTYLGLCWATTLGLVAVALGQQAPTIGRVDLQPPQQAAAGQPGSQPIAYGPDGREELANPRTSPHPQRGPAAPGATQDRSLIKGSNTWQPSQPAASGQPRGELGVWMVESGGPGVAIQRITRGSAAEQAGLRQGDIILQVNGKGAASPQGAAQLIRQLAIGQSGTIAIWRDGDQQQVQFTIQPVRQVAEEQPREASHQVAFGAPDAAGANAELASRTMKLEQQISSLTQELQQLRQELAQIKSAGLPVQQTGFTTEAPKAAPPANLDNAPPAAAGTAAPPPGFGETTVQKPATSVIEPANPVIPPATAKPAASEPFGAAVPPAKTEEKPKAGEKKIEEKPKTEEKKTDSKDTVDDLFK